MARNYASPSMRRVWIEILCSTLVSQTNTPVTLHAEGVD